MAGSWLAVVEGFGGMRMRDGVLNFEPHLPDAWRSLALRWIHRGRILTVTVTTTVRRAERGRTCRNLLARRTQSVARFGIRGLETTSNQ